MMFQTWSFGRCFRFFLSEKSQVLRFLVTTKSKGVHHKYQALPWIKSTLKISRYCGTLGDTGFLQFFRVVSRHYGKPRKSKVIFDQKQKFSFSKAFALTRPLCLFAFAKMAIGSGRFCFFFCAVSGWWFQFYLYSFFYSYLG